MTSIISDLLDRLTKVVVIKTPPILPLRFYVSAENYATGVKSLDTRLKLQLCVDRGGWRSIQVYVAIEGRKVVVLDLAEVHGSVYPYGRLGFEVPYVQTVADALKKILGSDPQNWTLAKEFSSDPRSGVDVFDL